jgi:hypothetical protein
MTCARFASLTALTFVAFAFALQPLATAQAPALCSSGCVTTHSYDNSRDNTNPNESILKATTISSLTAASRSDLMGVIYAQPLYLSAVTIGGSAKNVLYVATEENYLLRARRVQLHRHSLVDCKPKRHQ